ELRALPGILDLRRADLAHEHPEALAHAVLDPPDHHPLVLQRMGAGERQADPGDTDVHVSPYPAGFRRAKDAFVNSCSPLVPPLATARAPEARRYSCAASSMTS